MRVETELLESVPVLRAPPPVVVAPPRRRRRIDRFDIAVLASFSAVSIWVLVLDLWQVVAHGRVWTGTDGFYLVDQMQYLAWIRDASHHLLASNLFVLHSTPADYFQPAVAISGLLSGLGMPPWLSLLLWKPVAVGAAFYAVRVYARRNLTGLWQRRAALVLGLFFGSFSVIYGSFGVVGDLFPGFLSWGYTFGLLAVAAMLGALLVYDRSRRRDGMAWAPALLGALAGSLHPWQGELLILVVLGAELVGWRTSRRFPRRWSVPLLTVVATGVPLLYYAILGRADLSWGLAREASKHSFSMWTIVLALAPLALPAALAYRKRATSFLAVATRVWPIAAVAVYTVSATGVSATPLHAFEGVTIPLAVLAVQGVQGLRLPRSLSARRRLLGVVAVALATVPATAYELIAATTLVAPSAGNANFITGDERHALRYLAHNRQSGGVIARFYLGAIVPAETGRRTYVGHCLWSEPDCSPHAELAQQLIEGSLSPSVARSVVQQSGARFVLSDCGTQADLSSALGPALRSVHRFGCASVYEVA
jgi:hypothetical protein